MVNAVWAAIQSRLAGGTALISALSGTAIYHIAAPDNQACPYVIYSQQGGGLGQSTPHVDGNGLVYIRAYSTINLKQAQAINELIFNLMNNQVLTITGWNNSGIFIEPPHLEFKFNDPSGKPTWTSGDVYRLIIDKN